MILLLRGRCCFFLSFLFILGCANKSKDSKPQSNKSTILTSQYYKLLPSEFTNIYFENIVIESRNFNYLIYPFMYFGGGVATGDINNDGLPDIYFTGNMGQNKLYLNKGDLKFVDISKEAGVEGLYNHWTTGVTMADINNDGYLDLYVSVAGPGSIKKNLLYINNKDNTFRESATEYGIACTGHSMQSVFFDYDNDGDLDLYVGNYPLLGFNQTSEFYEKKMKLPKLMESDRLYRNDDGVFKDVTKSSGILNYGLTLGLSVADFNNDGWSDIYVSNDFNSLDYLYINQKDGSFSNEILSFNNHTSNFGMGIDSGDINNDGLIDFVQLDMMGNTNQKQKANMSAMNPELFHDMVARGLHHQYMKNVLQLNTGVNSFIDIGEFAGISNTDWSWGTLLMDMNNDGLKDIFITNGMLRNVNDNDYNAMFRIQKSYGKIQPWQYINWVQKMPSEPVENFTFHNNGDLSFQHKGNDYGLSYKGFSNGASYADLDNDGDLDIVVNNLNSLSQVYENKSSQSNNYIRIKLRGVKDNKFGLGTRVSVYTKEMKLTDELSLTRGYESSVEPIMHFGLGGTFVIDSIEVNWPKGEAEMIYNIKPNQLVEIVQGENKPYKQEIKLKESLFEVIKPNLFPKYAHKENEFDDFEREVLLPHKMSQLGPALAVGDINNDGLDDFFVGGAKGFQGQLYKQNINGSFNAVNTTLWANDKIHEDVSAVFFDANNDGNLDLFVVSGGNEKPEHNSDYIDRLFINMGNGNFTKSSGALPKSFNSGSCVVVLDFDNDGDKDVFVGGRQIPGKYPMPASSVLLRNDSADDKILFTDVTDTQATLLNNLGMVTDAVTLDINDDGWKDLILTGEWMSLMVLENRKGIFQESNDNYGFENNSGWWNCITLSDIDSDGDLDLIAGNNGLNYKYKASSEEPFKLYSADFDSNGKQDIVLGYFENGEIFPLRGRECSSQQIPSIKKRFPNYQSFSQASLIDVYSEESLEGALKYEVETFASKVFLNKKNKFVSIDLPNLAQMSSINSIYAQDFTNDGKIDLLLGGNMFESEVETPRNDASIGLFLKGEGNGKFNAFMPNVSGVDIKGEIKHISKLNMANDQLGILIVRNDSDILLLKP